jgi:hypothetical protein
VDCVDYAIFFERETPADFLANVKKLKNREAENETKSAVKAPKTGSKGEIVDDAGRTPAQCSAVERCQIFGPM